MGPSAFLNSPMCHIEGMPDRTHEPLVRGRRPVAVRIQSNKSEVLRTWVAHGVVFLSLRGVQRGRSESGVLCFSALFYTMFAKEHG
jgi:hypothetical protein